MNIHDWQAAVRSGRWHTLWCRPYKLCSDLNSQPKRPGDPDLWPFDLESGVRVTCDVDYLCANFSLPRPLHSRVTPDLRDRQTPDRRQTGRRQTSDKSILGAGIITSCARGSHNMPRPLQVDLWPFDLENGVRVTCDVGYLCANFSLPGPLSVFST